MSLYFRTGIVGGSFYFADPEAPYAASRAIVNIDGDNDVYAGQQAVTINVTGLDLNPLTKMVRLNGIDMPITFWNGVAVVGGTTPVIPIMPPSTGTAYYLRQAGDDNTGDGLSRATGWATFNYAQAQLSAGDILYIEEGTYTESSGLGYKSIDGLVLYPDIVEASWAVTVSGTSGNPITFMADPTNTTAVVLDSGHIEGGAQSNKAGIFIGFNKFLNFSGIEITNCLGEGIYNMDHAGEVVQESEIASDIWIEDCKIHHVGGTDNDSAIGIWSGRRVTIINNYLYDIYGDAPTNRNGWGVLSYGFVDCLIRNNTIEGDQGIFLKDHYVVDAITREPVVECEIAYNLITVPFTGINIGVQPATEAGINYVHHNIVHTTNTTAEARGISLELWDVRETTAEQRIEHNLVIGAGATDSTGMLFSGTTDIKLKANMIFGFSRSVMATQVNTTDQLFVLTSSDYGLFDSVNAPVWLGRYGTVTQEIYNNLTEWQAALATDTDMLAMDNPDTNGAYTTLAATITSAGTGDYSYAGSSPATGIMLDGSNAGPYQIGNEVIGVQV
jgi:hypothetical protein